MIMESLFDGCDNFEPMKVDDIDVKPGDIIRLGDHLLMCGDSTCKDDVEKLMGTEKADLVFTDPPYGMGKENVGVANDNLNSEKLINFNRCWMNNALAALQDNGSLYCWGTDESCMNIYAEIILPMARSGEVTFRNLITWWKGEGGLGIGGKNLRCYPSHSEKCLFVMKGNKGFATLKDYNITFCEELKKGFRIMA